jgi:hypothetical protein
VRLQLIDCILFFLKKEPKTVALRGFNELNVFCSFLKKEPKQWLCEASAIDLDLIVSNLQRLVAPQG